MSRRWLGLFTLGVAARRRAEDFSLSAMLDGTCQAYAAALDRRGRHV